MNRALLCWLLGASWLAGAAAQAQGPADERQRLAEQRAAVEARFAEREAACQQRFAVTDCVNQAKQERRAAMAPLRRRSAALDDAQRKERAARQSEELRRQVDEAQAREREAALRESAAVRRPAAASPAEAASAPGRDAREPKVKEPPKRVTARSPPKIPTLSERRAMEAAGQARIDARRRAAQEHREAAERRNAQRAQSGKPAASPLPAPASGALP